MSNVFRAHKEENLNQSTRHFSSKQEAEVAKAIGGKVTANSGATMWQKGDLYTDNFLVECKTCVKEKKSFTIKEDWLTKARQESLFMNKDYFALAFNFGPNKPNFYIIDEDTFKEFLDYIRRD